MRIDELIARVDAALQKEGAYAFLPEIRESLERIKTLSDKSRAQRTKHARGIEGFILDNYQFSESQLGTDLLAFTDDYVEKGLH